jgi:hypothetical protein
MIKYLKYILLILVLTTIGAQDGRLGTTSTGTCRISITIPPKVDIKQNPQNPQDVNIETNFNMEDYNVVETQEGDTKVIILEPK